MKAYEGIISKKDFVAELTKHQAADNFLRGTYWNGEKGCAVGCSLKSIATVKKLNIKEFSDHAKYEEYLGIPEWLARLEDTLFEGLSENKSRSWPVDFAKAIKKGADLDKAKVPFVIMLMEHSLAAMAATKFDSSTNPAVVAALAGSKAAVEQMIAAQKLGDPSAIEAAESAAWSAAESAWSAARSAAESAAWSAAESAARSARSAAWSAESAAESAARSARSAAWSAESAAESAESAARSAESAAWLAESAESAARSAAESAAWSAAESAAGSAESAAESARSAESAARSARSAAWLAESAAYDYYAERLIEILKECK